nr:MAG TPA: hypothetical protein [Caudoviricetes sp.]
MLLIFETQFAPTPHLTNLKQCAIINHGGGGERKKRKKKDNYQYNYIMAIIGNMLKFNIIVII